VHWASDFRGPKESFVGSDLADRVKRHNVMQSTSHIVFSFGHRVAAIKFAEIVVVEKTFSVLNYKLVVSQFTYV